VGGDTNKRALAKWNSKRGIKKGERGAGTKKVDCDRRQKCITGVKTKIRTHVKTET